MRFLPGKTHILAAPWIGISIGTGAGGNSVAGEREYQAKSADEHALLQRSGVLHPAVSTYGWDKELLCRFASNNPQTTEKLPG